MECPVHTPDERHGCASPFMEVALLAIPVPVADVRPRVNVQNDVGVETMTKDDVKQFHASAKVKKYSKVKFQNDKCKMGPNSEDYCYYVACPERVGKMAAILNSF